LPVLTQQLSVHADFIAKTEPEALGPVAKALAGLAGLSPASGSPRAPGSQGERDALDAKHVSAALVALQRHLDAPTTTTPDLVQVIAALAALGGGTERLALGSHLLLYHSEDELGGDAAWQKAIVSALAKTGGPAERELLRQVASDPRTKPTLASTIREVLGPE
jgi:hypothetical protein